MGVIISSFNLNISPRTSYGVLECDIVMLQNYMLVIKYWVKRCVTCAAPVFREGHHLTHDRYQMHGVEVNALPSLSSRHPEPCTEFQGVLPEKICAYVGI